MIKKDIDIIKLALRCGLIKYNLAGNIKRIVEFAENKLKGE